MAPRVENQDVNYLRAESQRSKDVVNIKYVREGDFQVVTSNVVTFVIGTLFGLVSFYYVCTASAISWAWYALLAHLCGLAVTVGAHMLWSHRSFKAKLPLRLFLALWQSVSGQNCIYIWARDHRVHHKGSDTDADPHNIRRGAFFAHVGWLLHKKHPDVIEMGKTLKTDDLLEDPVVYWQMVYYYPIYFVFAFFLPIMIPVWFWNESLVNSFFISFVFRSFNVLHSTWFINSAAHMWGDRPYNSSIQPTENYWMSFLSMGGSYHNFHHTFPYDYRSGEFPAKRNIGRHFIDLMYRWGQAYDLKTASDDSIESRKEKTALSGSK